MNKASGAMSYDELRGAIAQRHRALSGRLQQIAEFVLDHPTDVALGTVAEVAQRSGVPPSAIVRFAHALGFGGFTEELTREWLVKERLTKDQVRVLLAEALPMLVRDVVPLVLTDDVVEDARNRMRGRAD